MMKNMKVTVLKLIICLSCLSGLTAYSQSTNTLWYNQPAQYFEETLVLGNGRMGASVFGGVESDKIFLNDITLWSGEPVNANKWPDAFKNLAAVREALKNEDYQLAEKLNRKLQGDNSHSYAPLGTLFLNFENKGTAQNYYRELNIANAVSKVEYEVNGVKYTREYFISHPDKVMVIKLTSSKKGALNFNLQFTSQLKYKVSTEGNKLTVNGRVHIGNDRKGPIFDDNRGTRFSTLASIKNTGGKVTATDSTLVLMDGTEAIVYVSVATSFNGFDKDPSKEGVKDAELAAMQMDNSFNKSFKSLKNAHMEDYHQFFNRVSLDLGKTEAPNLPTNERLMRYADGKEDKNLEVLYFQYGRYLLISSSRTEGVPANLQGLWNPYINPPWRSNYTVNINVEENYWLAENTNLSEMHGSLLGFIKNISETGKTTARTFYGINGWAACHNSDIWAMSNPVGNGTDEPMWACWNMGGAWLSTHLWEHYLYTQDKEYLKNHAYEIMKGAAQFCMEWLVEDKDGKLITMPSTSPENKYVTPDGFHGATFYGGTADLAMIRACMTQAVEASKVLDVDADFRQQLESALGRLLPYRIGKKGNLQEWYYDWDDEDPRHRHQSHLFGLYPGHDISPLATPELANACKRTLEIKGDETTGWSKGWRINLWARLLDGNHAYQMYRTLLRYVSPDGAKGTNYHGGGGTYPNFLNATPPFQIDGNFGGAAAVAEMLVQSTDKEIRLLPALPDAWAAGSVKGICARGGFEIAMEWENKMLKTVTVTSKNGGTTNLVYGDKQKTITLARGKEINIKW